MARLAKFKKLVITKISARLTSLKRGSNVKNVKNTTETSTRFDSQVYAIENLNQNTARPLESSMAEMAVQGLLEFWPCKSVNNPNFGLPIAQSITLSHEN